LKDAIIRDLGLSGNRSAKAGAESGPYVIHLIMVGMIPWVEILKHAPAILAAADALRTRVRSTDAGDRTRSVDARLAELEDESRASAQLTKDMAQQINALTLAHESAAQTARRGLALGVAALVLAIAAVILAIAL
jgi:hypothetical protein